MEKKELVLVGIKESSLVVTQEMIPLQKAIYSGVLPLNGIDLECAVLEDGSRILTATSVFAAFDRPRKGMNTRLEVDGTKIPPFLAAKNLEPYIDQQVRDRTKLITYRNGNSIKRGYSASLLPKMCEVYLNARRNGHLIEASQGKLAIQSEILLSSLAQVGIDALIDEATGYQYDRKHDALRLLLSRYIVDGFQKWMHTFPDSFFVELDRLYDNEPSTSQKRPQYYGHFINRYVYGPIEHGYVKERLNQLNITDNGKRRARFHQWLSNEGRNILIHHMGKVQGLMEMCMNIEQFKMVAEKQKKTTIAPYLFEEMNKII
jgi:hypothetical protein